MACGVAATTRPSHGWWRPGRSSTRTPGDAWEGQTLDRTGYAQRARFSRRAFPDLRFTIEACVAAGERVAVRWSASGAQLSDLPGLPAAGRPLRFSGQTFHELAARRVAGHWQVVDRLGFLGAYRRAVGMRARV